MAKEFYDILGVAENASEAEIKKAYRKKAMEYHPDRNQGDKEAEAQFKKINEAYSTLSDPQKKANYDRFGSADGMGGFGGFGGGFQGGFAADDLGDIFSQFFGGGFGGGGARRRRADMGEDIEIRMKISLEDAIKGVSRKVEYQKNTLCEKCHGKWGERTTCEKCHGSGTIRERVQTVFGVMEQTRTCDACHGEGTTITEKCSACDGKGKKSEKISKTIEVPKGIEDGMSIKMREEWHAGKDGNGDLYITFSVPSEEGGLKRSGANLHYSIKISPAEATLGVKKIINIPILGKKELDIDAGTQHATEIIFKNEWLERLDHSGKTGNLIVRIDIEIPKKVSSEQKKLYEEILQSEGKKPKKWLLDDLFG